MEKYFLKVLHEEPVTELSLYDLVGGTDCPCNGATTYCPCNGGGNLTLCETNECKPNVVLCPKNSCPMNIKVCPPDSTIGTDPIN